MSGTTPRYSNTHHAALRFHAYRSLFPESPHLQGLKRPCETEKRAKIPGGSYPGNSWWAGYADDPEASGLPDQSHSYKHCNLPDLTSPGAPEVCRLPPYQPLSQHSESLYGDRLYNRPVSPQ